MRNVLFNHDSFIQVHLPWAQLLEGPEALPIKTVVDDISTEE